MCHANLCITTQAAGDSWTNSEYKTAPFTNPYTEPPLYLAVDLAAAVKSALHPEVLRPSLAVSAKQKSVEGFFNGSMKVRVDCFRGLGLIGF